jgi:ferredoxin
MAADQLPIGTFIQIEKPELQSIIDRLHEQGYQVIGPTVAESAVVYDEIRSLDQLPIGLIDEQDGGSYRLRKANVSAYFDYVVGPHSLKKYLFPPQQTILEGIRHDGSWDMKVPSGPDRPLAIIGARSCDLHALRIQDRVFLGDAYVDPAYQQRRQDLFIVAVNCRRAAATCFCHSMNTGPAVEDSFDLAITELADRLVVEIGSDRGGAVALATHWTPCTIDTIDEARGLPKQLRQDMDQRQEESHSSHSNGAPRPRHLDTTDIHDLLMNNLENPRWDDVAERCLACANCTMVCPTCFCSSVDEVASLTGDEFHRERSWDSCFNDAHSYMSSGTVRMSTRARYRQWLTHKLATWQDQFGTSGCVGCGRCITWCPVAIDLTEEVAAIRETAQ